MPLLVMVVVPAAPLRTSIAIPVKPIRFGTSTEPEVPLSVPLLVMLWTLLLLLPMNRPEDNEMMSPKVEGLISPLLITRVLLPVKVADASPLISELILDELSKVTTMLAAAEFTAMIAPLQVTAVEGVKAVHAASAEGLDRPANRPPTARLTARGNGARRTVNAFLANLLSTGDSFVDQANPSVRACRGAPAETTHTAVEKPDLGDY